MTFLKKPGVFPVAAVLIILVLSLAACTNDKGPKVKKGDMLPAMTLPTTEGTSMAIPADASGKLTVILFWSQGCHYCKKEMPLIEPVYSRYRDKGFEFMAVHVGPGMDAARDMKKSMNLTFPVLEDKDYKVKKAYGVSSVPSMFVLDAKGVITEKILGGLSAADIEKLITEGL